MPSQRRPTRRTVTLVTLTGVLLALFCVLVPVHVGLYGAPVALAFLLGVALCAAPILALTRPRLGVAVFGVAAFALPLYLSLQRDPLWPWPWSVPMLIGFAILIAVVTYLHGWRFGLTAYLAIMATSLAVILLYPDGASPNAATADLIVAASVVGGLYLVTVLLSGRVRVGEELTREREVSAEEQSRRVLIEERTRISREMHDVVAHSMSVIQVQASTARYRLPDLPADAIAEFDDIAATARASLTEMRRLLGVLRPEDQTTELAPQQGIDDIPALVDSIRRAGADVGLELVAANLAAAPASVQIATFRIVQEALSNAVRHAPGSRISVRVHTDDAAAHLRVHNTEAGDETSVVAHGTGHGLRGMRERVALVDGTLEVGPDAGGGWTVVADLPWMPKQENA